MRPKIKLILLIFFSTSVILLNELLWLAFLAGCLLVISFSLQKKDKLLNYLKPLLAVCVFIFIFSLFAFQETSAGINSAALGSLKILSLSLAVFIFTATTSSGKIAGLFSFLPYPLPLVLTLTLSTVPIIGKEFHSISVAQKSRGFKQGPFNFWKNILPLVVPLLYKIFSRSEQIGMVMQSRGYSKKSDSNKT
jgi:energy-coupling factor transporter transmembrane protein EcfT